MDEIGRKQLPHDPPPGIGVGGHLFFLTISAQPRGTNVLIEDNRADMLLESVRFRHESSLWFARVFVVMPDHVHALIRVPEESSLRQLVKDWKRWTARRGAFAWQRDFFDHRLRKEESANKKADYILMNPVRAGLAKTPEAWPHKWIASDALG